LPELLSGRIHLSSEREGSTFHIYLVIEGQGVLVKLEGSVDANKQTGQLTSYLDETVAALQQTPGAPGRRTVRVLANPAVCGPALTTSDLTPGARWA
jgi:hypothetical protein